jgi:hypothetical protein
MPDDATLPAAPAADAGQPAPQAVPAQTALPLETPAAPAAEAATAPAPEKLWANKYKAPEILEEAYLREAAEGTRMAQRIAELEKRPVTPAATDPFAGYTKQHWESLKEQRLSEAFDAAASGNTQAAKEAAHQVTLIDAKLREVEFSQFATKTSHTSAYERLRSEVAPIFNKYAGDLQEGKPVFNDAVAIYNQMIAAGKPDDEFTRASATAIALLRSSKLTTSDAAAAATATQNLNQALKGAAAAGSGAANTNASPAPDWSTMSNDEFASRRKAMGVGR